MRTPNLKLETFNQKPETENMKPLVYWCRWHEVKLRLRGRDPHAVWGELCFADRIEPFHFDLHLARLTYGKGDQTQQIDLDEMGVAIPVSR